MVQRGEAFTEYLAQHGLFVAGSSAVQGEWPKILLTEDANGKLFLDHALPDALARRHWLGICPWAGCRTEPHPVAGGGMDKIGAFLGLRVHDRLLVEQRALFAFTRMRAGQWCVAREACMPLRMQWFWGKTEP